MNTNHHQNCQRAKMQLKITTLFLTLFFLLGCQQENNKKADSPNPETTAIPIEKQDGSLVNWMQAINEKNKNNLKEIYASDAIKIVAIDTILNNASQISEYYLDKGYKVIDITSLFQVEAHQQRAIHYELLQYKTEDLSEYVQLIIWKIVGEKRVREFEFSHKIDTATNKAGNEEILERRDMWIELCNENNAANLVNELYSQNTIYFNHKPLVIGRKKIINEYAYMNNANYNLVLQPLKLISVTKNIAFEIGQCKGSYGGKYILIWKKEDDGKWRIFIDSNI